MLLAGGICELGDDCCWQVAAASAAAAGLACECSVVRTNDRIKGKQLAFAIRLLSNHLRSSQLGGLRSQPRSRAHGLGSFKTSSADSFILQRSWQANRSKPRDIRAFFALRMRSSRKPDAPASGSGGRRTGAELAVNHLPGASEALGKFVSRAHSSRSIALEILLLSASLQIERSWVRFNQAVTRQKLLQMLLQSPVKKRSRPQISEAMEGFKGALEVFKELLPVANNRQLQYINSDKVDQRIQYGGNALLNQSQAMIEAGGPRAVHGRGTKGSASPS